MLTPDKERCQAEKPTGGPFQLGGEIGDPKNGYRVRCRNKPTVIAAEVEPGEDGHRGSMSLCDECLVVFNNDMPSGFAEITRLETGEDATQ